MINSLSEYRSLSITNMSNYVQYVYGDLCDAEFFKYLKIAPRSDSAPHSFSSSSSIVLCCVGVGGERGDQSEAFASQKEKSKWLLDPPATAATTALSFLESNSDVSVTDIEYCKDKHKELVHRDRQTFERAHHDYFDVLGLPK